MTPTSLQFALASVPPGRWAIGVSGGADSVALLMLLRDRADLQLHVVHLDHQTRGAASASDAQFVRDLAMKLQLPCTIAIRSEVEAQLPNIQLNPSARYRAARMSLFGRVVSAAGLSGVLLAHHADDQAETVLHQLIRGSGAMGLTGMTPWKRVAGLLVLRPLLEVRRAGLLGYLNSMQQPWREDASNDSEDYLRNRLRRWLREEPNLHEALLHLAARCREISDWTLGAATVLEENFSIDKLREAPTILARASARQWLVNRGIPPQELSEPVLDRLVGLCQDAALPAAFHLPGGFRVRRRQGMISIDPE